MTDAEYADSRRRFHARERAVLNLLTDAEFLVGHYDSMGEALAAVCPDGAACASGGCQKTRDEIVRLWPIQAERKKHLETVRHG